MNLENVFVRLKNDVNGNPRYYVGAYDLAALVGVRADQLPRFAGKTGFNKYRGKRYGGGYVVSSYNLDQSVSYLCSQVDFVRSKE
nr:MAG TPA: hypothetical protein [Caudoviricetes sp.]